MSTEVQLKIPHLGCFALGGGDIVIASEAAVCMDEGIILCVLSEGRSHTHVIVVMVGRRRPCGRSSQRSSLGTASLERGASPPISTENSADRGRGLSV